MRLRALRVGVAVVLLLTAGAIGGFAYVRGSNAGATFWVAALAAFLAIGFLAEQVTRPNPRRLLGQAMIWSVAIATLSFAMMAGVIALYGFSCSDPGASSYC